MAAIYPTGTYYPINCYTHTSYPIYTSTAADYTHSSTDCITIPIPAPVPAPVPAPKQDEDIIFIIVIFFILFVIETTQPKKLPVHKTWLKRPTRCRSPPHPHLAFGRGEILITQWSL